MKTFFLETNAKRKKLSLSYKMKERVEKNPDSINDAKITLSQRLSTIDVPHTLTAICFITLVLAVLVYLLYGDLGNVLNQLNTMASIYQDSQEERTEQEGGDSNTASTDEINMETMGHYDRRYNANTTIAMPPAKKFNVNKLRDHKTNNFNDSPADRYRSAFLAGTTREQETCRVLSDIYQKPFVKARPSFLLNPDTGRRLELDCYNEQLEIGAEFQGIQHEQYPNPFHKSRAQFDAQIRRDKIKAELCALNGVQLIVVPSSVKKGKIRDFMNQHLEMAKDLGSTVTLPIPPTATS